MKNERSRKDEKKNTSGSVTKPIYVEFIRVVSCVCVCKYATRTGLEVLKESEAAWWLVKVVI